jgi:hypothetical protein
MLLAVDRFGQRVEVHQPADGRGPIRAASEGRI